MVSVAYFALVNLANHPLKAATDASNAAWFSADEVPSLAFDHAEILAVALRRLKGKVRYETIGFELLPEKLTLSQAATPLRSLPGRADRQTQLPQKNPRHGAACGDG